MRYVGDEHEAAPQLRSLRPSVVEAEELLRQLL